MYQKVKGFNVKSSTYYFHTKTKIMSNFQICINVPLIILNIAKFLSTAILKNICEWLLLKFNESVFWS